MAYKKPQNPLTNNGFGIYPLTTADQVILSDGSRLEKNGSVNLVTLPTTEETPGNAPTINAGTFGGMTVGQFVDMIYPVGSIYMSASATSPETLFGGTWTQITGRYLIGTDAPELNDDGTSPGDYSYAAGRKGGEAKHKLTISEIPSHTHRIREANTKGTSTGYRFTASSGTYSTATYLENAGGSEFHNNMPPYLAVYMWQRTA